MLSCVAVATVMTPSPRCCLQPASPTASSSVALWGCCPDPRGPVPTQPIVRLLRTLRGAHSHVDPGKIKAWCLADFHIPPSGSVGREYDIHHGWLPFFDICFEEMMFFFAWFGLGAIRGAAKGVARP